MHALDRLAIIQERHASEVPMGLETMRNLSSDLAGCIKELGDNARKGGITTTKRALEGAKLVRLVAVVRSACGQYESRRDAPDLSFTELKYAGDWHRVSTGSDAGNLIRVLIDAKIRDTARLALQRMQLIMHTNNILKVTAEDIEGTLASAHTDALEHDTKPNCDALTATE